MMRQIYFGATLLRTQPVKQLLRATGMRSPSPRHGASAHYQMPVLEQAGVQVLRMSPNTLRECRWGLHLDNNNRANPPTNGWVVRVWLELTDDPSSRLVLRPQEFANRREVSVALERFQQVVVDSEALYHGGHHAGTELRYALIVSVESGPALK